MAPTDEVVHEMQVLGAALDRFLAERERRDELVEAVRLIVARGHEIGAVG